MKCITCKGRGHCGRPVCPILRRLEEISALPKIGNIMEGMSPPEVFVGRYGYPLVRAGPVIPLGEARTPSMLGMDIGEIIAVRSQMVRSETKIGVKEAQSPGKLLEACQQIAMSSAPVGTEVSFFKPPQGNLQFDGVLSPSGPSGELKDMEITTNPLIPRKVDEIVEDRDAVASVALSELYSSGIGMDHISRMLSLGLLGRKRKLVPTRWSITACDSTLGNRLLQKVRDYDVIERCEVREFASLNNYYAVLLLPSAWQYEWIEAFLSIMGNEELIFSDFENNGGKNGYSRVGGCYYSCKMAVLEALAREKKQAGAIILREAYRGYVPLGVFNVRENVRNAMQQRPTEFEDMSAALGYISTKLELPVKRFISQSDLLREQLKSRQTSLSSFC